MKQWLSSKTKNIFFYGLSFLTLMFFLGCALTSQHRIPILLPTDISTTPQKNIFIMPAYEIHPHLDKDKSIGWQQAAIVMSHLKDITFKLQDYFKARGWNVLYFHKIMTEKDALNIFKKYAQKKKNIWYLKTKKQYYAYCMDPKNFICKGILNANFLLSYVIKLDSYQSDADISLDFTLKKLFPPQVQKENFKKDPHLYPMPTILALTFGDPHLILFTPIVSAKKIFHKKINPLLFTPAEVANYVSAIIISTLKENHLF